MYASKPRTSWKAQAIQRVIQIVKGIASMCIDLADTCYIQKYLWIWLIIMRTTYVSTGWAIVTIGWMQVEGQWDANCRWTMVAAIVTQHFVRLGRRVLTCCLPFSKFSVHDARWSFAVSVCCRNGSFTAVCYGLLCGCSRLARVFVLESSLTKR